MLPMSTASDPAREEAVSLAIIIPVYNEEQVVDALFSRLASVFTSQALEAAKIKEMTYVLVDDGSVDDTAPRIMERMPDWPGVRLIRLTRNFGHQAALRAGLANAKNDLVAVIDADLQDPPEMILEMLTMWRKGYDVVYGQRRKRQENILKRFCYWGFYRLMAFLTEIPIPLDAGDFCLMDRRVVHALNELPENQLFIRGLRAWLGFRQVGIEYDRPPRQRGETKYSLRKLYELATNGIASMSTRPLCIAQVAAFANLLLLACFLIIAVISWASSSAQFMEWPTSIVILLVLSGNLVNSLCFYVLSAYVGRGYFEAKRRPPYVIMETLTHCNVATVQYDLRESSP